MSHVISLKLNDEEWAVLHEYAERERLYAHGVIKIALREKIGLPVPHHLRKQRAVFEPVATTR